MQFSKKTFGSQNAIQQIYHQYSGTLKNYPQLKNKMMTQSTNFPFQNIYNAFNSTGNINHFPLDRFKHSEAKSIIEKLMQTNDIRPKYKEEDQIFFDQIKSTKRQRQDERQSIRLGRTEERIFCEVVNLIGDISQIKEKTQSEKDQLRKIKIKLKNQGIEFPQVEQKQEQQTQHSLRIYTSDELQNLYDENENLALQIQQVTKQIANRNQLEKEQTVYQELLGQNSLLKQQLQAVKSQIISATEVEEKDFDQLNKKVNQLKADLYLLQQKRLSKANDKDDQLKLLKEQNQQLRLRTIELLKNKNSPENNKKLNLIQFLKLEENNKLSRAQQIKELKHKYQALLLQNERVKKERKTYFEGPLQVQSKVRPFYNTEDSDYPQYYSGDKEKFNLRYENPRNYQNYGNSYELHSNNSRYSNQRL